MLACPCVLLHPFQFFPHFLHILIIIGGGGCGVEFLFFFHFYKAQMLGVYLGTIVVYSFSPNKLSHGSPLHLSDGGRKAKVPEKHIASRVKLTRFPIFLQSSAELDLFTILLGNPGFDLFTAIKYGSADQRRCKLALISLATLNATPPPSPHIEP